MADGVTALGGGWDQTKAGTAESLLGGLLMQGRLTGEELIAEMKAQGFGERGPAYYPEENGKGPFYALGNPHDYAAINRDANPPAWDLIGFDPATAVITVPPASPPEPAPPADITPGFDRQTNAIIQEIIDHFIMRSRESAADKKEILARIDEAQRAIQAQIDQVVKNAETSARALLPIAEAALPALSGLFAKK